MSIGDLFRLCAVGAFTAPTLADVLVVDVNGGTPFTQIQPAVTAAQDGDVILVRTGVYSSFLVRNKALSITADTDEVVTIVGPVRVETLAAGKVVVLGGLISKGISSGTPIETNGLYLWNDAGSVRAQLCTFAGMDGPPQTCIGTGSGAYIEDCADVALVGCAITGSVPNADHGGHGGPGITTIRSSLALYDGTTTGASADQYSVCLVNQEPIHVTGDGARGGHGCDALDSFVFASRFAFHGGQGANGNGPDTWGGNGGTGLLLGSGTASASLLECTFTAGSGGFGVAGLCVSCVINGANGSPYFSPSPSALTLLPGTGRVMLARSPVREGASVLLTMIGQPGDDVSLLASPQAYFHETPFMNGVQLVRGARYLRIGRIGATGMLTRAIPVHDLGLGVENRTIHYQPLFRDTSGRAVLGSSRSVVLLDSIF